MTKYGIVDVAKHLVMGVAFRTLEDALGASCGLQTEHGIVHRERDGGGLGIFVAEFGMYVPPKQQRYFVIRGKLYAGNGLLYRFNYFGETVGLHRLPHVLFLDHQIDVETAIRDGLIARPRLAVNGEEIWRWPGPKPESLG